MAKILIVEDTAAEDHQPPHGRHGRGLFLFKSATVYNECLWNAIP